MRILVVDDHEVVRRGLCTLLNEHPGWSVVGEAADGKSAVDQCTALRPELVIMDITMPGMNGLEATRLIRERCPEARVLILTLHESDELLREILLSGARGYLLKSEACNDLVAAVEALGDNRPFFSQKVTELILDGYIQNSPGAERPVEASRLSPREVEVVRLLAEGKTNREAAAILNVSVKTVESHRNNIMVKLNLSSFSELVRYAVRHHYVES